ncbi:MAG: glutathione S-transferase [Methylococcaceae bacterium]|nr:glutathione S-transferase [Methylococcaceae bacterium]
MKSPPILYSFRRCPYAIRARLAIVTSGLTVELREVVLRNKPQQLLNISPKGTVPVLLLPDKKVLDESLDIIRWALSLHDPFDWLSNDLSEDINHLIQWNDNEFKHYLDRYKYAARYPEKNERYYREKAELFLFELENRLYKQNFLCSEKCTLADIAIFPFIRQFANVNNDWFTCSEYKKVGQWLNKHINSPLFIFIMDKHPVWHPNSEKQFINPLKNQLVKPEEY